MTYFETHNALVTNNEDPDNLGRLKVKCATLLDEDQELPYWIPPRIHFVDKAGGGWFGVPSKDTWVELRVPIESPQDEVPFEQSLQMEGAGIRWECTAYNDVQTLPKVFKTNYPQRMGYAWTSGFVLYVDNKDSIGTFGYAPDGSNETWLQITKTEATLNLKDGTKVHLKSGKAILAATSVLLGSESASQYLLKGTQVHTDFTTYFTAVLAAAQALGAAPDPTGAAAQAFGTALAAAVTAIQTAMAQWLSTISATD